MRTLSVLAWEWSFVVQTLPGKDQSPITLFS